MYTWSNKNYSLQSWIDFWLVSDDLSNLIVDVLIETAILTDHKGIFIQLDLKDHHKYAAG